MIQTCSPLQNLAPLRVQNTRVSVLWCIHEQYLFMHLMHLLRFQPSDRLHQMLF